MFKFNLFEEIRLLFKDSKAQAPESGSATPSATPMVASASTVSATPEVASAKPADSNKATPETPVEGGKEKAKEEEVNSSKEKRKEVKAEVKTVAPGSVKARTQDELRQMVSGLDRIRLNSLRKNNNVDVATLDTSTEAGLKNVVDVFKNKLALDPNDVDWMADQLKYAFDENIWRSKSNEERLLFQNPEGNLSKIETVNSQFYLAYTYFMTIKQALTEQFDRQKNRVLAQEMKDKDPVFTFAFDKLGGAWGKFSNAVESNDWSTVGVYAAGAFAFYKLFSDPIKNLFGGGEHGKGSPFGRFLLYGTAAYAGMSIFAPDKLKTILGKGVNTDIKGTAWETLAGIAKTSTNAYEKGINAGVLAAVSEAKIKDIYCYITQGNSRYDERSSSAGMIQLTNSGIGKYFPSDLVAVGPIYLDQRPRASLDEKEKAYVTACEQLYRSALGFKKVWGKNMYSKKAITFEDKFLKDSSPDYTMEDMAEELAPFLANSRASFWSPELLGQARLDLAGDAGGKNALFKKEDALWIQQQSPDGQELFGKVFGYPIIIKLNENPSTNPPTKEYRFYLANDSKEGADPIATYIAGDVDSLGTTRGKVESAVGARMNEMLRRLVISGEKAPQAVKYSNNGRWEVTVTFAGDKEFGGESSSETLPVVAYDDGKALRFGKEGSGSVLVLDEALAERHPKSTKIIMDLMAQEEFKPLQIFSENRTIDFNDPETGDRRFFLKLGGVDVEFVYDENAEKGKRYSVVDAKKISEVIQSNDFQRLYIEARGASQDFKVFDKIKEDTSFMRQETVMHFLKSVGDLVVDAAPSPYSTAGDMVSGSIPNYYVEMLVDSKKEFLLSILRNGLPSCESFDEIAKFEKENIYERLADIRAFYNQNVRSAFSKDPGKKWTTGDFTSMFIDPLRTAGTKSPAYRFATRRFETAFLEKLDSKGNDVENRLSILNLKLMQAFYFHTASFDTEKLDIKKGINSEEKTECRRKQQYLLYVQDCLIGTSAKLLSTGGFVAQSIPEPNDSASWGILGYDEEWGKYAEPLDSIDEKDAYSVENTADGGPSDLQKVYEDRLKAVVSEEASNQKDANVLAMQEFLYWYIDGDPEKPASRENPSQYMFDIAFISKYSSTLKDQQEAMRIRENRLRQALLDPKYRIEIGVPSMIREKMIGLAYKN